jgi:hypothetical protein
MNESGGRLIRRACRGEKDFNPGVHAVDVFVEMRFDDAVVVHSEAFAQRILCNLQPPVHVAP